jgi:hypothetical protein
MYNKRSSPAQSSALSGTKAAALLLSLLSLSSALAQVTGRLSGEVQDPSGKALGGAQVTLTLPDSAAEDAATTTSREGSYFFPVLRPIYYDMTVEAEGFKKQTLKNVKVDPTAETSLPPVKMELGDLKTVVETTASLQTLQTSNGEVASTATSDQVSSLPLAERDPLNVLDILPGVSENGRDGDVRTIDGQAVSFANITFDGINIQQNFIREQSLNAGGASLLLRTDQINEATIVTSNPGAIYSGGSAQVAFSSRSGTNVFHGSAYWLSLPRGIGAQYFLNNSLNTPASSQLNQVGGTFGGPLRKDKLFFFINAETDRDRSTLTRTGSSLVSPLTSSDPVMQQILNMIPVSASGYRGTQNNGDTGYLSLAHFDYLPSHRSAFGLTISTNNDLADDSGDSSAYTRVPDSRVHTVASLFAGSWRWSPTSRLTNEVRVGVSLPKIDFQNTLRSQYGFIVNFGNFDSSTVAFPEPMAGIDPQGRHDYLYNYQDNLTYSIGRHSLQVGVSLQQNRLQSYGISNGSLDSQTVPVLYPIDIASGTVSYITERFNIASPGSGYLADAPPVSKLSANLMSGYLQDNWKVKPWLAINLGVRYDYLSPAKEVSGTAILPELAGGNAANAVYNQNLPFSFVAPGQGLYNPDRANFAPYVGFAWKVSDRVPVVVRGAYNISYVDDDLFRNMSGFAQQNPFQSFQSGLAVSQSLQSLTSKPVSGLLYPGALPAMNLQALNYFYANNPLSQNAANFQDPFSSVSAYMPTVYAVDPNLKTPFVQQMNIGIETEAGKTQFAARYVGNRLERGLMSVDRNQLMLTPASLNYLESNGAGPYVGSTAQIVQEYSNAAGLPAPYNFFGNPLAPAGIDMLSNLGRSSYDSLQLTASRRVAAGLNLTANYVFSKTLSNEDDYQQGAIDPFLDIHNQALDHAPSPFNLTSAFKSTVLYALPFADHMAGRSVGRKVLGGWSLSGIAIAQSGAPFSLLSGLDTANTPQNSGQNTVTTSLTSGQIEQYFGINKSSGSVTYVNNFPASTFGEPAPGSLGTLQRRMFSGPGAFNLNLGLRKVITLTERMRMEVRAESINVLNRENWLVGDQTLAPGGNGQPAAFSGSVTQWTPPRTVQFQVRLLF